MDGIDWHEFLGRPALESPSLEVVKAISSAPILITGAGGYIGSALALHLVALAPASLVLLESAENNLYRLQRALNESGVAVNTAFVLGDSRDRILMEDIFAAHAPRTVFHAAAYKHVPLLEEQPLAAIANNIFAAKTVACVAAAHGARVVLLSTDKAVEPVSVMGATKRVAEDIVLGRGGIVLRLGNVLASTGSVGGVFADQIARGGPLTITDPDVRRYLLTVDEAVNILLIAAAHPLPSSLLVPALPATHGIADLARFMARELAPGREIPICFTDLRPGDKLVDRLWSSSDLIHSTDSGNLLSVQSDRSTPTQLEHTLAALHAAAEGRDLSNALAQLRLLVPDFQPGPAALAIMHASGPRACA
jgi:FlaA1/EpsC-like NDP-sugar epimerase